MALLAGSRSVSGTRFGVEAPPLGAEQLGCSAPDSIHRVVPRIEIGVARARRAIGADAELGRDRSSARLLAQLFATETGSLLEALAERPGLTSTRRDLVLAYAAQAGAAPGTHLASFAAIVHRLAPGLHIFAARIGRAELLTSDAHRKHVVFHALRATGITWMAVQGDDPLCIKQRAGHKSFSTTEGYIREAENLREGFGTPFPPLPLEVLGGFATVLGSATAELKKPAQNDTSKWSKGGSNP